MGPFQLRIFCSSVIRYSLWLPKMTVHSYEKATYFTALFCSDNFFPHALCGSLDGSVAQVWTDFAVRNLRSNFELLYNPPVTSIFLSSVLWSPSDSCSCGCWQWCFGLRSLLTGLKTSYCLLQPSDLLWSVISTVISKGTSLSKGAMSAPSCLKSGAVLFCLLSEVVLSVWETWRVGQWKLAGHSHYFKSWVQQLVAVASHPARPSDFQSFPWCEAPWAAGACSWQGWALQYPGSSGALPGGAVLCTAQSWRWWLFCPQHSFSISFVLILYCCLILSVLAVYFPNTYDNLIIIIFFFSY